MAIMTRFGRSGVAYVQPGSKRCSMPLDPQHGSSCTVDQNLEDVAALTELQQSCFASVVYAVFRDGYGGREAAGEGLRRVKLGSNVPCVDLLHPTV